MIYFLKFILLNFESRQICSRKLSKIVLKFGYTFLDTKIGYTVYTFLISNQFRSNQILDTKFGYTLHTFLISNQFWSNQLLGFGRELPKADYTPSNFLKAVFHKFYLIHSWILCPERYWHCLKNNLQYVQSSSIANWHAVLIGYPGSAQESIFTALHD